MKTQLIGCLLIGLLTTVAQARMGEGRMQCIARYGIAKSEVKLTDNIFESVAQYKTEGLSIGAYFVGTKVECLTFEGETQKDVWTNEAWREFEIHTLLERNGGGKKWEQLPPDKLAELGKTLEVFHYLDELMLNHKAKLFSVWATTDQELVAVNFANFSGPIETHKLYIRTRRSLERQLTQLKTDRLKKLEHF